MKNKLWQYEAKEMIEKLLATFPEIKKIEVKGSMLDETTLDKYSDVDLEIHLAHTTPFDIKRVVKKLPPALGYEIHNNTLRICLWEGWRFDLSFIYPAEDSLEDKVENLVNSFWFTASMVLTKLGRGDNLIASHLALELCRQTIVMQMLIRDRDKNTNTHRFGDNEHVPVLHSITQILDKNEEGLLIRDILFQAAQSMDKMSSGFGYAPRTNILRHCIS